MCLNAIVYTDCETDDFVAILALIALMKSTPDELSIKAIIVGEGFEKQIATKYCLMKKLLDQNGFSSIPILCETPSNYDWYPSPTQFDQKLRLTEEVEHVLASDEIKNLTTSPEKILQIITNDKINGIICMMTHQCLTDLMKAKPNVFNDLVLYSYGSFNFRRVNNKDALLNVINSFKEVHIVESFLTIGAQNQINEKKAPQLIKLLKEISPLITEVMKTWNAFVHLDAVESCVGAIKKAGIDLENLSEDGINKGTQCALEAYDKIIEDPDENKDNKAKQLAAKKNKGYLERNHKVYLATLPGKNDYQMVFADMLIPIILLGEFTEHARSWKLSFNELGYSVNLNDNEKNETKVKVYENIPYDLALNHLCKILQAS
jgi:hypothetical protein